MGIDPEIRAMLDALAAPRTTSQEKPTLAEARSAYRRQYLEMSRAPEGDVEESTLRLQHGHAETLLQLCKPAGLNEPLPVILYLHGGGFVLGDSAAYSHQSARIALECNAAVAFLDYRLSPEHPFPAALEDTLGAARWIAENAETLGVDASRFGLMGDSAGGNLAIAAMLHFRAERYFRCAGLLYPVVDMRPYLGQAPLSASDEAFAAGYYLERRAMEFFAAAYLPDGTTASDPRASPVLATDLGGLPPILIFGAENDLLRDQGRLFAEQLKAAGNDVDYRCFDGVIHNFMQHSGISRRSDAAFLEVCGIFGRALATKPSVDALMDGNLSA